MQLGSTALLLAAVKGRCGIVMLLAVAGASPEAKDNVSYFLGVKILQSNM